MSTWAEVARPGERPPGDAIRPMTNRPDIELEGDSALRTSPSDITRTPHLTTGIEPRTTTYKKGKRKGPGGGAKKKGGLAGEGPGEVGSGDTIYPCRSGWLSGVIQAPADDDHHNHTSYATLHGRWDDDDGVELPLLPHLEDDEIAELPQRTLWSTDAEGGSTQAGIMPWLPLAATPWGWTQTTSALLGGPPETAHEPEPEPAPLTSIHKRKNKKRNKKPGDASSPPTGDRIYPHRSGWLSGVIQAPADDDHHNHTTYATPHGRWDDEDVVELPPCPRLEDGEGAERVRAFNKRRAATAREPEQADTLTLLHPAPGTGARPSPAVVLRPQQLSAPVLVSAQTPPATAPIVKLLNEEPRIERRMSLAERLVVNQRVALARESEGTDGHSQLQLTPAPGALPSPAAEPRPLPPRALENYPGRHNVHPPPSVIPAPPRGLSFSTPSTEPEGSGNGATAAPAPSGTRWNPRSAVTRPKARTVTAVPPTPASPSVAAAQEAAALLQLCMDPGSKQDEHERQQLLMLAAEVLQRQLRKGAKGVKKVKEVKEVKERAGGYCVICLETTADTVLVPCGHLVLCATCCMTMGIVGREVPGRKEVPCPICRTAVKDRVKVFRA